MMQMFSPSNILVIIGSTFLTTELKVTTVVLDLVL